MCLSIYRTYLGYSRFPAREAGVFSCFRKEEKDFFFGRFLYPSVFVMLLGEYTSIVVQLYEL